jgi:DNA repair exonuclease SbcCD nuclease subunit
MQKEMAENKIVLISDIHYHLFQAFSPDGGRSRLADISSVVQQCHDHCVRNNIEQVAILGDIFEKRGTIESIVYNTFTTDLKRFLNSGIKVYIIPGNHDQDLISNATWSNSLEPLSGLSPNLKIISEPELVAVAGKRVLFVPYIHAVNELQRRLTGSNAEYAFVHAGIAGARLIDSDYRVRDGLDLATIDNIPIFSGHYHTPQTIGNAVYLGSPIHHSFNDSGQQKSFIELDLNTEIYSRINTVYPRFIKMQIEKLDEIFSIDSQDYYRIVVAEKVLDAKHHAHLQVHTKNYEVVYTLKKDTAEYTAAFDNDKTCLRKFIESEFTDDRAGLYKAAKYYIC